MKSFVIAAALIASVTAAAPAFAQADDAATCQTLAGQVQMGVQGSDPRTAKARQEQRLGLTACRDGNFAEGASHYRKALSILTGQTALSTGNRFAAN